MLKSQSSLHMDIRVLRQAVLAGSFPNPSNLGHMVGCEECMEGQKSPPTHISIFRSCLVRPKIGQLTDFGTLVYLRSTGAEQAEPVISRTSWLDVNVRKVGFHSTVPVTQYGPLTVAIGCTEYGITVLRFPYQATLQSLKQAKLTTIPTTHTQHVIIL